MIKKAVKFTLASIFGMLSIGLVVITGVDVISFRYMYGLIEILQKGFLITILSFLSFFIFIKTLSSNKHKQICMWFSLSIVFTFYCFILINLLFTSRAYYHNRPSSEGFFDRIKNNSNFIPFKTIIYMITREQTTNHSYRNLIGNLLLMTPMGFFLPIYLKKLRKLLPFTITITVGTLIVELIQAATNVGVLDIDDLILNLLGAVIAFAICHIKISWRN